jgi:hypothetical protein
MASGNNPAALARIIRGEKRDAAHFVWKWAASFF